VPFGEQVRNKQELPAQTIVFEQRHMIQKQHISGTGTLQRQKKLQGRSK